MLPSLQRCLAAAALLWLTACDESLPPRIVPEDALVVERLTVNQQAGPTGIFFSVIVDLRNLYEETFSGAVDVTGNIRIWWPKNPDVEANLPISQRGDLLLDPGQIYSLNRQWFLLTDDGRNVFDMLDFSEGDIRFGVHYAAPEVFLVEVQVKVFGEVGLLYAGPQEFVVQGWYTVGEGGAEEE